MSGSSHPIAAIDGRHKLDGFVRALRALRRGESTPPQVHAELDRVLAGGRVTPIDLLATLIHEDASERLPTQVFEAIEQKLKIDDHWDAGAEQKPAGPQQAPELPTQSTGQAIRPVEDTPEPDGVPFARRYEFIEHIDTGRISFTLKAIDRTKAAHDPGKHVAIEAVKREFETDEALLAALESEVAKNSELIHPNIAAVLGFERIETTAQIAVELVAGESLAEKLRLGQVAEWTSEQILDVVEEIGQALAFAHARGLVHGGITPGKIFLTRSGRLKATDFVISRAMRAAPHTHGMLASPYTSPEMLAQQVADPRDDVYSLACVTYELLTGNHPFARTHADEAHRTRRQAQRIARLNHRQWRALSKGLALTSNERTPSITQFLTELNARAPRWHPLPPCWIARW